MMLDKVKRIGGTGGSNAPIKVKLKSNQIQFKMSEIKTVVGDKRPPSQSKRQPSKDK